MSEKRPRVIKVGYFTIKIKYCDDLDGLMGDFNSDKKEIRINTNQTEEQIREVLFHELLHVVMDDSFIFDEDEDRSKEEKAVRVISPKLMELMTTNKKLRKYLFDNKEEETL